MGTVTEELDKDALRLFKNAFDAFDHEKQGLIETSEMGTILEMLGVRIEEKVLKAAIDDIDVDETGMFEFEEFCQLASKYVEIEENPDAVARELKEAFRLYDKDGQGYISTKILRDILHELDDKLTPDELNQMIDEIDSDGSGTVDFDEFMEVMQG